MTTPWLKWEERYSIYKASLPTSGLKLTVVWEHDNLYSACTDHSPAVECDGLEAAQVKAVEMARDFAHKILVDTE